MAWNVISAVTIQVVEPDLKEIGKFLLLSKLLKLKFTRQLYWELFVYFGYLCIELALLEDTFMMLWIKHLSSIRTLAIALMLGLVTSVSVQAQLPYPSSPGRNIPTNWNFDPPPVGKPRDAQGGATRGPCVQEPNLDLKLTALVREGTVGSTASAYPSFYWYVPKSEAKKVQFVLMDDKDNKVYETEFTINGTPGGIARIDIPASASVSPLEVGKQYYWELTVMCNPDEYDFSSYMIVDGWIKRVEPDPTLASRLEQATPEERLNLYATNRYWYDTVDALAELRRMRPNDTSLVAAWEKLLQSVDLNAIARQPVFPSLTEAVEPTQASSASTSMLR